MKFICEECAAPCILDTGDHTSLEVANLGCIIKNSCYCKWEKYEDGKVANLQPNCNNLATNLQDNALPKLTAEVFDRPECPEWAQYAAVDISGMACFYDKKPKCDNIQMWLRGEYGEHFMAIRRNKYDASDWQNSLVERPTQLPDWCKVGEWVYYRGYRKIIEVKGSGLVLESAHCCNLTVYLEEIGKEVKQARLRPYNAAEMRVLIGKVLASNSRSKPFSFLVVYAEGDGSFIESYRFKYTAEELKDHFTIDGSPCGVLEHFKEGEWVK